jgi:glycerol kinase
MMVYNNLLMQFHEHTLNIPVILPKVTETTAMGAVYAAGFAVCSWSDLGELCTNWAEGHTWRPAMAPEIREKGYRGWKKAAARTLNWVDEPES